MRRRSEIGTNRTNRADLLTSVVEGKAEVDFRGRPRSRKHLHEHDVARGPRKATADAYRLGNSAKSIRAAVPLNQIRVGGRNLPGTVVAQNRQIHIPDLDHLDPSLADFPGLPRPAPSRWNAAARCRASQNVANDPFRKWPVERRQIT
jgi:hypothetical protein